MAGWQAHVCALWALTTLAAKDMLRALRPACFHCNNPALPAAPGAPAEPADAAVRFPAKPDGISLQQHVAPLHRQADTRSAGEAGCAGVQETRSSRARPLWQRGGPSGHGLCCCARSQAPIGRTPQRHVTLHYHMAESRPGGKEQGWAHKLPLPALHASAHAVNSLATHLGLIGVRKRARLKRFAADNAAVRAAAHARWHAGSCTQPCAAAGASLQATSEGQLGRLYQLRAWRSANTCCASAAACREAWPGRSDLPPSPLCRHRCHSGLRGSGARGSWRRCAANRLPANRAPCCTPSSRPLRC